MIEKLKITLKEIIQQRNIKIGDFENRLQDLKKQEPQTDFYGGDMSVEVMFMLAKEYLIFSMPKELYKVPKTTINDVFSMWINNTKNSHTRRTRQHFINFIKRNDLILTGRSSHNQTDEFNVISNRLNWTYLMISRMSISEKTKQSYISNIKSIEKLLDISYLSNIRTLNTLKFLDWVGPFQLSRHHLADLLKSLEQSALKSTSLRPSKALLLVRALFYAPLPAKKLLSLPAPDEEGLFLQSGKKRFYVHESFVNFWKCFGETEYLFPASMRKWRNPESQLNTTVKRLGKQAKLPISLTPTMLCSVRGRILP